jgi:hypothetical protein
VARGRKRKIGSREANGQLSRADKRRDDPLNVPQSVIRRIIAHHSLGDMEVTQFASLRIKNEVTQALYDAGLKYRECYAGFQSALEVRQVKTAVLEPSFGSSYDVDTPQGQDRAHYDKRAVTRYETLAAIMDVQTGRDVHDLVVNQQYLDWARLHSAKNGLKLLAIHLRLMRREDLD